MTMNLSELATAVGSALIVALALLSITGSSLSSGRKNWWTGRSQLTEWFASAACAGWAGALLNSGVPEWASMCLVFCAVVAALRYTQRADNLHDGFTPGDTCGMLLLGVITSAAMLLSLTAPKAVGAAALLATIVAAYSAWNTALVSPLTRMTVLSPGYSLGVLLAGIAWALAGATGGSHLVTAGGGVLIIAGAAAWVSGRRTVRRRIR